MKRIIVPTDFSDAAWSAFLYAVKLAERIDAKLIIINSYREPHAGAANIVSIERILRKDSERGLEDWLNRIRDTGIGNNLDVNVKSIHSGLLEALNSQIKGYDQQFIVMGTLGETGTIEKLIGSNASNVVAKVKCPVFVIPHDAKFSFSKKIVLAANFHNVPEKINLRLLEELCLLHPSDKIEVVHVKDSDKGLAADKIAFDYFLSKIPYNAHKTSGRDISETLDKFISKSKIDLLVLIKKKKGLFESIFQKSVTKKLSLRTRIPLLILKAQE